MMKSGNVGSQPAVAVSVIATGLRRVDIHQESLVELSGIEPLTSAVRLRRSPI